MPEHREFSTTIRLAALQTATVPGSLALAESSIIRKWVPFPAAPGTAEQLFPLLTAAMKDLGWSARDLDVISVAIGPGSFTGLRISVAAAKVLGYALGCRLSTVSTMQTLAAQCERHPHVRTVLDAQQHGVYWQDFDHATNDVPFPRSEIHVESLPMFLAGLHQELQVTGPGLRRFDGHDLNRFHCSNPTCWEPRADTVARLSWPAIQRQEFVDPFHLMPHYVRCSAATELLREK